MKFKTSSRGFTLIELLVVIAIIAILSGIIITSLTSSRSKARDAQRISDLNQIQLALEQYFDRCGQYPMLITDTGSNNGCPQAQGISLASYITTIPVDPSTGNSYDYAINNSGTPTDYVLHALLENQNQAQANSLPESIRSSTNNPNNSWMTWTSGTVACYVPGSSTSKDYCISTK